jgi:hypothetical protein
MGGGAIEGPIFTVMFDYVKYFIGEVMVFGR